jgi:hypothetical protein
VPTLPITTLKMKCSLLEKASVVLARTMKKTSAQVVLPCTCTKGNIVSLLYRPIVPCIVKTMEPVVSITIRLLRNATNTPCQTLSIGAVVRSDTRGTFVKTNPKQIRFAIYSVTTAERVKRTGCMRPAAPVLRGARRSVEVVLIVRLGRNSSCGICIVPIRKGTKATCAKRLILVGV